MPLAEPNYEPRSSEEVQYEQEVAAKIKATLTCPEQVAQRYQPYFAEVGRPIQDFFLARWGNDTSGMEIAVSTELRLDIAQELLAAISKVWAA